MEFIKNCELVLESKKYYKSITLDYALDDLEPWISKQTMDFHYNKHYKGYVNKLNELVRGSRPLADLVKSARYYNDKIKFNAGGAYNHQIFFSTLKKDTKFRDRSADLIKTNFRSLSRFQDLFTEKALAIQGSGWCWLVIKKGRPEIITTANQDNPLMYNQGAPVFGLDMWEHAFYVDYGPDKAEYIKNFFKVINWDTINQMLVLT